MSAIKIIAKKLVNGKEQTRTFTLVSWNLMGKNKEGWMQVDAQEVKSNVAVKGNKPDTGEAKQENKKAVSTKTKSNLTETKTEKVESNLSETKDEKVNENTKEQTAKTENLDKKDESVEKEIIEVGKEKQDEFILAVIDKGVKKGTIKDYFDTNKIDYDNNADEDTLHIALGKELKWDLKSLNLIF